MSDHYYTSLPLSSSEERDILIRARGVERTMRTDNGVFSKDGLDSATERLITTAVLGSADRVLDLGAGYGPISAILGTVYPNTHWTLIDVNSRALHLAEWNTLFMSDRRTANCSDGVPDDWEPMFDAVFLNPPIRAGKSVVYRLFADAHRVLDQNGVLWVVIQKKHGAPSAEAELFRLFGDVRTVYKKSGYFIFAATKC